MGHSDIMQQQSAIKIRIFLFKLFGFQKTGTDLQLNFRVPHASQITEGFSLSSWQKLCGAYFSLITLGQGTHQATKKAFSPLPHSVNDEPDMNIWK